MSDTKAALPQPIGEPNSVGLPTTPKDQVVALAKDFPDMLNKAVALDPDLANKWTGQALIWSKTVWGTATSLVVVYLVRKYSLGWDQAFIDLISGAIPLVTVMILRSISDGPISGFFRKATIAEVVVKTAEKDAAQTKDKQS